MDFVSAGQIKWYSDSLYLYQSILSCQVHMLFCQDASWNSLNLPGFNVLFEIFICAQDWGPGTGLSAENISA